MTILRNIGAVILGLIVGMALNMGLVLLNMVFFPMPEGISMSDQAGMAAWMAELPQTAFILPVMAHMAQAFGGAWVAARIGASRPMLLAMIIGVLSLIGGVMNMLSIPGPIWMWAEMPLYILLAGLAGWLELKRRDRA